MGRGAAAPSHKQEGVRTIVVCLLQLYVDVCVAVIYVDVRYS
jgi:hypothetical protein